MLANRNFLWGSQLATESWLWVPTTPETEFLSLTPPQAIFDQGMSRRTGQIPLPRRHRGQRRTGTDFERVLQNRWRPPRRGSRCSRRPFYIQRRVARVDILNPVGKSEWDIIESNPGTEVKDGT